MTETESQSELLTMSQAAEQLKTTRATLYRWLREGQLSALKVGRQWRFKPEEVERFLQGRAPRIELPADPSPFLQTLSGHLPDPSPPQQDPLATAFTSMVEVALHKEAESLHLSTCFSEEEAGPVSWLRGRIDGSLQLLAQLDNRLVPPLIDQWKRAACCDTREKTVPQDGRIVVTSGQRMVDILVSFLPTPMGEAMTAKIVDRSRSSLKLSDMELPTLELSRLKSALKRRNLPVALSGGAGSDKTRMLSACLREVAGPDVKLFVIDNTWEFLPWATQISLGSLGRTRQPSIAIRTVLRSDPDVIGVPRLPDPAALEAAQEASLRGALVVVGVDADGVVRALRSLLALAGSAASLAQTLELVVSQRLVRRLCTQCSQRAELEEPEFRRLELAAQLGGLAPGLKRKFRRPVGCEACGGSGYRKRSLLMSSLRLTPSILELLSTQAGDEELLQAAIEDGTVSLDAQAIALAAEGVTSVEEALRFSG